MPEEGLRWKLGRSLGCELEPREYAAFSGERGSVGGEKGPITDSMMLAELVLRALSFSARSARKRISKGDSARAACDTVAGCRVGVSESLVGGEGSWLTLPESLNPGESVPDLERKLGIGSDEGAGDAWNVAPANAVDVGCFAAAVCGGV